MPQPIRRLPFLSLLTEKPSQGEAPRAPRPRGWAGPRPLSEHPKAAIHEHLKSGHTFRRNVQDIDSSEMVSSLSQHGECLEGREETANHSVGTTGMVSAKDPKGHADRLALRSRICACLDSNGLVRWSLRVSRSRFPLFRQTHFAEVGSEIASK